MNGDDIRLIARIQHFYDIIGQYRNRIEDEMVSTNDPYSRSHSKLLSDAYGEMASEYQKVFGNILYKE
jgi:hypothetical protein